MSAHAVERSDPVDGDREAGSAKARGTRVVSTLAAARVLTVIGGETT